MQPKYLRMRNNKLTITFLLCVLFIINWSLLGLSQCDSMRYRSKMFTDVTVYHDVKYGAAQQWNIPYNDQDLLMDIYLPTNDTLTHRPLMIWAHPGGFLNGSKGVDDMVAFCDSFAKRGYVTVSIDYRLGFNPLSSSSAERAVYRGVQDMRTAIRFMKENYQVYGIDTNYTFLGGSSAGAFMVCQVVYMDQNEAPSSIGAGMGYPALGCLDCTGNLYQHPMDITAFASLWGAVGDSTWVQAGETTPALLVHGKADGTVPFGVGYPFGLSTLPKTHGSRCISNQMTTVGIPHKTYFVEGKDHEFYGADNGTFNNPPNVYWDTLFYMIQDHFYEELPKNTFAINGPSVVCTGDTVTFDVSIPSDFHLCWIVNNGTIVDTSAHTIRVVFQNSGTKTIQAKQFSRIMAYNGTTSFTFEVVDKPTVNFLYDDNGLMVQFSPLPSGFINYNWEFGDGTGAGNMGPSHLYSTAGTYLVSLTVKDTNGCKATISKLIQLTTVGNKIITEPTLMIYPNPVEGYLIIRTTQPQKKAVIYDLTGKKVRIFHLEGKKSKVVTNFLSKGTYLLKVITRTGASLFQKLSVQ